jgi:hypothetical protein
MERVEPFREQVQALHDRGVEGPAIWQLLELDRIHRLFDVFGYRRLLFIHLNVRGKLERIASALVLPHPEAARPDVRCLRSDPETEYDLIRLGVGPHSRAALTREWVGSASYGLRSVPLQ